MIESFLKRKPLTSCNSPTKINKKFNFSKNNTPSNIKSIKQIIANKYCNNNIYDISSILKLEKNLRKKEKKFKTNVCSKIIEKRDLGQKIYNNVALLENKIIDNYNSIKNSHYNYNTANKNIIKGLRNKKRLMILNKENNNYIYKMKNDINEIENKIVKYNNLTELYEKNYNDINNQVIELKKECKILPGIIDNLENENRNLNSLYININSNIMKIKYELLQLDKNKKNIRWDLYQINKLYK